MGRVSYLCKSTDTYIYIYTVGGGGRTLCMSLSDIGVWKSRRYAQKQRPWLAHGVPQSTGEGVPTATRKIQALKYK